jgi:hypothetical protein
MYGRALSRASLLAFASLLIATTPAWASTPTVTVEGEGVNGGSPDSTGLNNILVDATLAGKAASGTLETQGRYGGLDNGSYDAFNGEVTCMIIKGNRVIVGAFGKASRHDEHEGTTILPGSYMQVAVVEFGEFEGFFGSPVRHAYGSLGTHHEGEPSTKPPSCKKLKAMAVQTAATEFDSLALSPSITKPKDGAKSSSGTVKFAGTGEPNSVVIVYQVGHLSGTEVPVNAQGKWSLKLGGFAPGEYEYTAKALSGSKVLANTVSFEVL